MDFISFWNPPLPSGFGKPACWRLDVRAAVLLSHARDSTHRTWRSLAILYAGQGIHEFGIQGYLAAGSSGTETMALHLLVPCLLTWSIKPVEKDLGSVIMSLYTHA